MKKMKQMELSRFHMMKKPGIQSIANTTDDLEELFRRIYQYMDEVKATPIVYHWI